MRSFKASLRGRVLARVGAWLACTAWALCGALAPSALAQAGSQAGSQAGAPAPAVAEQAAAAGAGGETGQTSATALKPSASATLEQCFTATLQSERSATFGGEMTAIAGSVRMEMRIELLERMPAEPLFHSVLAPGLGVWRTAATGVKVYKYIKQVTNLSAPATYQGAVAFRWLNARGRPIKQMELRTPRCEQPAPPAPVPLPVPAPSPSTVAAPPSSSA